MQKKQNGFSLIELLVVVALILIIVTMAIPSLLRARIAANETSAVASLKTIDTAQLAYAMNYSMTGFAPSLAALGGTSCTPPNSMSACLIDSQLASGTKSGYSFTLSTTVNMNGPNDTYSVAADPVTPNHTGVRFFCSLDDGVVRSNAASLVGNCSTWVSPLQ